MDRTIETDDGRDLCLQVEGPPDGPVILFHQYAPSSRLLYAPDVADAVARGARLVGWDRPGYGGSTRDEGRAVADAVGDIRTIAAALDVDRLVTWGMSGGGPYALAAAALAPDLVAAAAVFGCIGPHGAPGLDFYAGMGSRNAADLARVLADPEAADRDTADQRESILWASPEVLRKEWSSGMAEVDDHAFTGELAAHMVEVVRGGLAPGPGGWIDDNRAVLGPWGFDVADIAVPVQLWHGRQDRFVPFAHGQWLAARIPGVDARLLDGDGQLTLTRRVPEGHAWLLDHLG